MAVKGAFMKNYSVTGGIVTYNNADIIVKCIESIINYTKNINFKLYIYDNHSSDNTVSIIERNFPQVIIIKGKVNRGFGYGHNRIIKRVCSQYHVVINPDVFINTDVISLMSEYMNHFPNIGILMPKVLNPDGSEQFLPKRQPNFKFIILSKFKYFSYYRDIYTGKDKYIHKPVICDNISGSFFMINTELMKQIGGFDERYFMYFEDADLGRRVNGLSTIVYNPNIYIYHAWKRDNTRSIKGIFAFLMSMIKFIVKWKLF